MAKKKKVVLSNNPTLLSLLKAGCKIEFENGYSITGLPKDNYIQESVNGFNTGLHLLNKDGLKEAHKYRKQNSKNV